MGKNFSFFAFHFSFRLAFREVHQPHNLFQFGGVHFIKRIVVFAVHVQHPDEFVFAVTQRNDDLGFGAGVAGNVSGESLHVGDYQVGLLFECGLAHAGAFGQVG